MSDIIVVEVTSEDIGNGRRGSYGACPIALALKRQTDRDDWQVGQGMACYMDDRHEWADYVGDSRVSPFIEAFDSGETVVPTRFTFRRKK